MSERKARWAMWSLGSIANRVIVEMRESDKYEIAAIVSSKMEKATEFIERNGLKDATPYTDIEEVLKRDDIDIVYIASPPWLHKEQACQCMEAGKAVLIEKPMTLNTQDAIDIFDCAKKNNVFCVEGVWTNYFPAMKKTREWIKSGAIGDVVEVITSFGTTISDFGDPSDTSAWANQLTSGGGALSQFGPYNVNLAEFVFEKEPDDIVGFANRLPGQDGADLNTCFLFSYDDSKAHVMGSAIWTAKSQSQSRISGTKGEIIIGDPFFCPFDAVLRQDKKDNMWLTTVVEEFHDDYASAQREGFKYQFEAVSDYVLQGLKESPDVPFRHSIELAHTMERLRKVLKFE